MNDGKPDWAVMYRWSHLDNPGDILAYRVIDDEGTRSELKDALAT